MARRRGTISVAKHKTASGKRRRYHALTQASTKVALPVFVCVMGEPWGIMIGCAKDNRKRCPTACTRV